MEKIPKGKKISIGYVWSEEEIAFLKEKFGTAQWDELLSKLDRTKEAILEKAKSLKLKREVEVEKIEKKTWLGYNCEKREPNAPTCVGQSGGVLFQCYDISGRGKGRIGEGATICKFCPYSGQICSDCGNGHATLTSFGILCDNCYDKRIDEKIEKMLKRV